MMTEVLQIQIRGSSVNTVTRLRVGRPSFDSQQGRRSDSFSSPPRLNQLWGQPSLLSNG